MKEILTSSCELLLALAGVYLLAVGLLTAGLPRILMGSEDARAAEPPVGNPASAE